ncbi:MAG TPA: biotin carboxylase N-terminal domain-containing protein [Chloroflexota bacterium]|nr:biotin carboxylase N-terminal domain-containing protein [Chloroflexota bacterium]
MSRSSPPFAKILVANRGEIAVRIIRAVHELGGVAIAVYSDADQSALHVTMADDAYRVGPGEAAKSYLNAEAILHAARESDAGAIHPGYGFLAENTGFAEAVRKAGLVFIGPPPEVIRLMGDKISAKQLMAENGVPLVPGYNGEDQSLAAFAEEAARIGFPVLVKAAAGGGGRGMRVVEDAAALEEAMEGARREAVAAFADGRLFLEKLLISPRHIEVQVLGDTHGNLIHLYERDCSVQRRHQKVVEEAPSPALNTVQREEICDAGVRAARAAGYVNAGTVEFLWSDGEFYFLEMNTRIQVEHGVTELVTGRDLVKAQIEIAAGRPLAWSQEDVHLTGHAIEARLYAEDPDNQFLPQFGPIRVLAPSFNADWRSSPEVVDKPNNAAATSQPPRVSGIDAGIVTDTVGGTAEISRYYDPMIAKLLTWSETRPGSIGLMRQGLDEMSVNGTKTNLDFLRWILGSKTFVQGLVTIDFVETKWGPDPAARWDLSQIVVLGAVGVCLVPTETRRRLGAGTSTTDPAVEARGESASPWTNVTGWRVGGQGMVLSLDIEGHTLRVNAERAADGSWRLSLGETALHGVRFGVMGRVLTFQTEHDAGSVLIGSQTESGKLAEIMPQGTADEQIWHRVRVVGPVLVRRTFVESGADRSATGTVSAPMPGTIVKVTVAEGDQVAAHQPLLVLEAMKMEHVLDAPHAGSVRVIRTHVGDLVAAGEALIELEHA